MRTIVWRKIKRLTLRAEEHNPPWASASISESDMAPIAEWIKETGIGHRTSFDMVKFRSETEMSMFLLRWGKANTNTNNSVRDLF